MQKPRQYERIFLLADAAIRHNEAHPQRFAARMFNVSKRGMAVFSKYPFSQGELVGMEMILPVKGEGMRRVVLHGTVRHVKTQPGGNIIGIEFFTDDDTGDYEYFLRYADEHHSHFNVLCNQGFTLVELCIVMVIICLLVTLGLPMYTRSVEQARMDVASAKLKTIWSGQRVYWLENHSFAPNLSRLKSMDLVDSSVAGSQSSPGAVFVYQIICSGPDTFTARALRNGSGVWVGQIELDESGQVTGAINGPNDQVIVPSP